MIKAIIFDTDGMVVNGEMWSKQLDRDFGIPEATTKPFFQNEFQKCLVGKADLKKEIAPYLPKWRWDKSVDKFLGTWFKAENKVDERIIQLINLIKKENILCCLATNQEKYRTEYLKSEMGFGKVFDKIFSSADIGYKKPERQFFEYIFDEMPSLKKDEINFWDDKEENAYAAQDFGFDADIYNNYDDFEMKIYSHFTGI